MGIFFGGSFPGGNHQGGTFSRGTFHVNIFFPRIFCFFQIKLFVCKKNISVPFVNLVLSEKFHFV